VALFSRFRPLSTRCGLFVFLIEIGKILPGKDLGSVEVHRDAQNLDSKEVAVKILKKNDLAFRSDRRRRLAASVIVGH